MHYKISVFFVLLFLFSGVSEAIEDLEDKQSQDMGIASVWAVGQFAQGGYLKLGLDGTGINNQTHGLWSLEAAWRFTEHFKFGANLRSSFAKVNSFDDRAVLVALLFGWHTQQHTLGRYAAEIKLGTINTLSSEDGIWFIEPGIQLIDRKRLFTGKPLSWIYGISYRQVEDRGLSLWGRDSLASLNFNIGLIFGSY